MRFVKLKLVWRYGNYSLQHYIFLSLATYRGKGSEQNEPNPSILRWHKMTVTGQARHKKNIAAVVIPLTLLSSHFSSRG